MNDELMKKANAIFYSLTKSAARNSFIETLEDSGLTIEDWRQIKQVITNSTGIDGFYV